MPTIAVYLDHPIGTRSTGSAADKHLASIPVLAVSCGFSFLLVLTLLCGFCFGFPVFLPPQNPTLVNSNLIWTLIRATSLLSRGYYVLTNPNKVIINIITLFASTIFQSYSVSTHQSKGRPYHEYLGALPLASLFCG